MIVDTISKLIEELVGPIPVGSRVSIRLAIFPPDEDEAPDPAWMDPAWTDEPPCEGVTVLAVCWGRERTMAEMRGLTPQECDIYYRPEVEARLDGRTLLECLNILDGKGPGGDLNHAAHDGYFARAIEIHFGAPIHELRTRSRGGS